MPVLIPSFLASRDAAKIQPFPVVYAATTTGLSRSNGFACCSTLAKQELRSTCITVGGAGLKSVVVIGYFQKFPGKIFRIEPQMEKRCSVSDGVQMEEHSSVADRVM